MLTIDDINSINQKYGDIGYWYTVDTTKIDTTTGQTSDYDFLKIEINHDSVWGEKAIITGFNRNMTPVFYCTRNGEATSPTQGIIERNDYNGYVRITIAFNNWNGINIHFFCYNNVWNNDQFPNLVTIGAYIPQSPLQVPVINGLYDDKFYILKLGSRTGNYLINGNVVESESDDKGVFIRLPSMEDCNLGWKYDNRSINLYNVSFKEFKTLPILSIPSIYKGNTQTIQLLDDTEEITEFQAYYKGEVLTDNKITLPYDADDYIDITVDLLDNRYPNSTLKLKAPTMMYTANSQSDVENVISQGITTLQVGDTETEVLLNGIDLTNVQLVNSHIQLNNCTLTDCQLIQSTYTDNGANNITDTNFNECEITTTQVSTYNNCTIAECTILNSELYITGTLQDNTFTNSLIVSDGEITLTNNTFTGIGSKTYFPSHLYLTGDYTLQNNTFNLTGTFTELSFNMCLIKATTDFNVGDFINKNTFNLNIEYETEPTSTLYYNIVDDDKIRARRI